jgi:hypothetical protein
LNVLIYALGGGWGHLTRAAALAHAMGPSDAVRILSNSPYIPLVQTAMPHLHIESTATREAAVRAIQRGAMDILVVDTFPRGLGGELAAILPFLQLPKILIHRALNPAYVTSANLREFVATNYQRVLCPGEQGLLADLPQAIQTAPWLIRDPVGNTSTEVIVCAGGNSQELGWYGEVTALLSSEADVRCIAATLPPACPASAWLAHWPAIDWIAGCRAVVGGAGYNTVNECLALGIPLIAKPWPRKYDDQRQRAERHPGIRIATTPEHACRAALGALSCALQPKPAFKNGVSQAAAALRALFS